MLSLQQNKSRPSKCVPNILPCRINHNGVVNASRRYWAPTGDDERKSTAYFRGRKLHGTRVKLPGKSKGLVLSSTETTLPKVSYQHQDKIEDGDEEAESMEDIGILEEKAEFDEIVIWGYGTKPEDTTDPYIRGVEEWIAFAEKMHSFTVKSVEK